LDKCIIDAIKKPEDSTFEGEAVTLFVPNHVAQRKVQPS
jgi:hypothetical protein